MELKSGLTVPSTLVSGAMERLMDAALSTTRTVTSSKGCSEMTKQTDSERIVMQAVRLTRVSGRMTCSTARELSNLKTVASTLDNFHWEEKTVMESIDGRIEQNTRVSGKTT